MADSLYHRVDAAIVILGICFGLVGLLYLFGDFLSTGPIVSAPVPGPCGCGGRCCQAAEQDSDGRWELPLVIEIPLPDEGGGTLK